MTRTVESELSFDENIETIFKVEPPLTKVEVGHGYVGVVLRNIETDKLQCHICGKWFKSVSAHVNMTHHISSRDYKRKFSLPIMFPLVGRSTSAKHSKQARTQKHLKHLSSVRDMRKLHGVSTKVRKRFAKYARNNTAFQNKIGVCEEQIMKRFLIVADIVEKEPSQTDLKIHDRKLYAAILTRYKNLNNFRRKHGFKVIEVYGEYVSEAKIIAAIRKRAVAYSRVPVSRDFLKGSPHRDTIVKRFGSWNRALVSAGFDTR